MADVRYPAVAGAFYESSPRALSAQVASLLNEADCRFRKCKCVISPHAGYIYSGKTAAFAINALEEAKTFVILGPNHTGMGDQFAVMKKGIWKMPMGDVEIDGDVAERIEKSGLADEDEMAHLNEHSIEVQIPFLQKRFKNFKIVPICIMNVDYSIPFLERCIELGKELAAISKRRNISVIASSDFSHYLPLGEAKAKDDKALENILTLDVKNFFAVLETTNASVCGYGPIAVAMQFAKELGLEDIEIIHESSSGDLLGDYTTVVTYKAIGFRQP